MTDPRPICPIPPDAKVGDVLVYSDGTRHSISCIESSGLEDMPIHAYYYVKRSGEAPGSSLYVVDFEYADGRKPNLPNTKKPKRTQAQRDAAWLRLFGKVRAMTDSQHKRILAIADRLEEQQ